MAHPHPPDEPPACHTPTQPGDEVTITDLRNTIKFLQRLVVGQSEQDTFFKTLKALETELQRRTKK